MTGTKTAPPRKPVVPKSKPKPTDKDKKKQPPRPIRVARTLPYEDYIRTVFNHNLDVIGRKIFLDNAPDDVDDYDGSVNSFMYSNFIKAMTLLEQESAIQPITIILASFGGSVDYGLAIYDRINISPCPIVKQGYGPLMSMGSVISQAKGILELAKNVSVMMHFSHSTHAKHDKLGKTGIAEQDRHDELMLDIYCERARSRGKTIDKEWLNQQMKDTLYLTADKAVELGFADGIITKA